MEKNSQEIPQRKYTEEEGMRDAYWPLLSVDEDLAAGDVHPVPGQSQTQLVRGRRISTWETAGNRRRRCGGYGLLLMSSGLKGSLMLVHCPVHLVVIATLH